MKYAIGIDLGGTFIKYAIINKEGRFLYNQELPSRANHSSKAVLDQLKLAITDGMNFARSRNVSLCGIGIGTPGITDETNRIVVGGAENIAGWENIPLADMLEDVFGLPVRVANDANMMGLGEQAFGAAKGCTDVLFITVGTGIGGAVIIQNKLYGGYKKRGTEFGHIPLIANGEPCTCGSVGCLETYASTAALVRRFIRCCEQQQVQFGKEPDGKLIVELYQENNPIAVEAMNEHWRFLGHGIAGLINIFSPQRVIVGGGISEAGDFYISHLEREVLLYSMPDCRINTKLCAAKLGNRAGTMGAAQMIFQINSNLE